jgi:hypothetical protein
MAGQEMAWHVLNLPFLPDLLNTHGRDGTVCKVLNLPFQRICETLMTQHGMVWNVLISIFTRSGKYTWYTME